MQVNSQVDPAALIERLVAEASPRPGALDTWRSFLQAHATLMRRLAGDLVQATGLRLGDFDVLGQLAVAGGKLRMSELAARAFSSRSTMTRRVARLVDEGLVTRASDEADARGVVVALTEAGVARLAEAAPVHLRGVVELFVSQLTDEELALLKSALDKVTADYSDQARHSDSGPSPARPPRRKTAREVTRQKSDHIADHAVPRRPG